MMKRELQGSRMTGLGHYQPPKVLTNDDIAQMVDTDDEWIQTRTGIRERHVAAEDQSVVDMAARAARMALQDAGRREVSMIVVASTTSESRSPNVAGRVAQRLGLDGPAIIDVNTACSGFEYAVATADQAISLGSADSALVIGAEKLSAFTDWTDRTTCVLTADGAGAVVLEASARPEVSPVVWGSVTDMADDVTIDGDPQRFAQNGRQVMRWAFTQAAGHATRVLEKAGMSMEDIDVLAFHQANLRLIEPLAEKLGATDRHILIRDVEVSGNTSAASVPMGLSKAWHRGELPRGGYALLFGFGGGFAFAGQVVKLPE